MVFLSKRFRDVASTCVYRGRLVVGLSVCATINFVLEWWQLSNKGRGWYTADGSNTYYWHSIQLFEKESLGPLSLSIASDLVLCAFLCGFLMTLSNGAQVRKSVEGAALGRTACGCTETQGPWGTVHPMDPSYYGQGIWRYLPCRVRNIWGRAFMMGIVCLPVFAGLPTFILAVADVTTIEGFPFFFIKTFVTCFQGLFVYTFAFMSAINLEMHPHLYAEHYEKGGYATIEGEGSLSNPAVPGSGSLTFGADLKAPIEPA